MEFDTHTCAYCERKIETGEDRVLWLDIGMQYFAHAVCYEEHEDD